MFFYISNWIDAHFYCLNPVLIDNFSRGVRLHCLEVNNSTIVCRSATNR